MKHLLFLLFATGLLCSCEQKSKRDEVIKFSKILYTNTGLQIKEKQQAFINQVLKDLEKIKDNNDAKIDINYLRELLDSAKQANNISYTEISKLQEVDEQINLRKKSLDEIKLIKSAYTNEFEKMIVILEGNEKNKFDKIYEFLYGKLKEIDKVQNITKEAEQELINKYDIPSNFNK